MLDIEILQNLSNLLAEKMSLLEFQKWFTSATWDIDKTSGSSAKELTSTLELLFAEHSSGHLPWDGLRQELLPLVRSFTVSFSQQQSDEPVLMFSSDAVNSLAQFSYGSPVMALA
jgi:hypothetical protein